MTQAQCVSECASSYYDANYFNWQKDIGAFGGWANAFKFKKSVKPGDTVIDFGCGGGFLLQNLNGGTKIGIEPNAAAVESVRRFGITHFASPREALDGLGGGIADVIVSNHALEHTLNPLQEIKSLRPLLKTGGVIHFFVPCEGIGVRYKPKDINYHLFTWSPQNLGNLFTEAGYAVEYSRPCVHKWPPGYRKIARLGWPIFNLACRVYGKLERSWFQVEVKARKLTD
jgi:SAM-dependent methyltransferase